MSEESSAPGEDDNTLAETVIEMQRRISTLEHRLTHTEHTLTQRIIDLERDLNRRITRNLGQSLRH